MKYLALLAVVAHCTMALAEQPVINYQTLPASNLPDYTAPAYVTEGNVTFRTLPGSTFRDYRAPSYVTKGNVTFQSLPSSNIRDYSAPAYVISKAKK